MRGKIEKNCTDLLGAERKRLNTFRIVIDLCCEDDVLEHWRNLPVPKPGFYPSSWARNTQGVSLSDPSTMKQHFISQLAEFSTFLSNFGALRRAPSFLVQPCCVTQGRSKVHPSSKQSGSALTGCYPNAINSQILIFLKEISD